MVRLLLVSGVLLHWLQHWFPALADPEVKQIYLFPVPAGCPDHLDTVKCCLVSVCLRLVCKGFWAEDKCLFLQVRQLMSLSPP